MIDSHCHLYDSTFDRDREAMIQRAFDAGIECMIVVGCDLKTSREAVELADRHERLFATIGVHPHESAGIEKDTLKTLMALSRHKKVVGYGEIGLDFYYMHSPREIQETFFREQVEIARDLRLPVVVHSRDAKEATLAILREGGVEKMGGVMHCFTGDLEMARGAIGMNLQISFSGVLTFRNAQPLREVARNLPLDRLMLETDSPYLAPIPYRGVRNEPQYLGKTLSVLSSLHPSVPSEEVRRITSRNARNLFGLGPP